MVQPEPPLTPKRSNETPVPKGRSRIERTIIWSGIALLLLLTIFEGISRYCYDTTFRNLEAATRTLQNGTERGVPVAVIDQAIQGFCFRKTEVQSQPNGGEPPNGGAGHPRTILFRWPSLFRTLQLGVRVTETGRAIDVMGDYIESPSVKSPSPMATAAHTNAAQSPASEPLPSKGLAHASEELLALSTNELYVTTGMRKRRLGSLIRELLRQSFLISARDELKLLTLDESLAEIPFVTTSPQAFPFQVNVSVDEVLGGTYSLIATASRPQLDGKKWMWTSKPVPLPKDSSVNEIIEAMEELSRDQFVSALKSAGYQPRPVPAEPPPAISDKLEYALDTVSQYSLIKQLHALRRQQGDTLENLAALSRAYARLSSLVEYHWSPMSKVFSARSLLYAQRLQSKFGKSCVTIAHRAYAWALVGNLHLAEQNLTAARDADTDPSTAPEWINTIDAYCQFQATSLGRVTGPQRRLALYFRMKSLDPHHDEVRSLETIRELLLEVPGCARAVQRMCELSGLLPHREATEGATNPVWKALYEQLNEIQALPSETHEIVTQEILRTRQRTEAANQKVRLELIESLRNASTMATGTAEPSWSLLGEIFSNEIFTQTVQLLYTSKHQLGFPQTQINEIFETVAPGVKGHRFEKYLLSFMEDAAATRSGILELYNSTNPAFFEMPALPIAAVSRSVPGEISTRLYEHLDNHWDKVQFDLQGAINSRWDYWQNDAWPFLIEVCPHQPLSIARQIHTTPEFNSAKGREWESKYSDNGYLMYELALKYRNLDQPDDAIRCLKLSIEAAPTHEAYFALADLYTQRDDIDSYIETLETSLNLPSLGLEHGRASEKIANVLMSQARWKEALPYARASAETYSGWGLLTGARCEEALKNWKAAEGFYRAASERYDNVADQWYWWCIRTNRGNRQAAREHLQEFREKYSSPLTWQQLWDRGGEHLLTNDLPGAIATFSTQGDRGYQDFRLMLLAAVFAERQQDLTKRDAMYEVIQSKNDLFDLTASLGRLFRHSLKEPGRIDWHEPLFLHLIDRASDEWVPFAYYCAGEFLANHHQDQLSLDYLQMAATVRNQEQMSCCFATMALRQLKQKTGERRSHVGPDERAKGVELLKKSSYYSSHHQPSEALALLTEAIESTPNFAAGLMARGLLYEEGRDAEAFADYEACLKIDPDFETANFNLASLLAASSVDELRNGPKALRFAQRAAELSERPTGTHHRILALAYAECGNFPEAVKQMEEAVKQSPQNQKWADQLALIRGGKPYRRPAKEQFPTNR